MEINEFYLSTICHVCKKYSSALKRCSACKLFAYCSPKHQQTDWNKHKQFCGMIKCLLNKNGKKRHHILQINGIESVTNEEWRQTRTDLKVLWQHLLKRRLTRVEDQVWMFPRVCEICRTSKQDILFDCDICYSASYCCVDHQRTHMNIHDKCCNSLKICYEINFYLFNNKFDMKSLVIKNNCTKQPVNTGCFVESCTTKLNCCNDILIGDIVSPFLTIFHGLQTCGLITNGNYVKNCFVVHVVGASSYEESLPWDFFVELFFRWIQNVTNITVVLIGPELQAVDDASLIRCSNYKIMYERRLYHDYVNSQSAISADLIAVFNCGLHEYQKETVNDIWSKSIHTLTCVANVPLIITSYTLEEALLDFKRLSESEIRCEVDVVLECAKNSFAGLRPIRDWAAGDSLVFFQNNYISILKTK